MVDPVEAFQTTLRKTLVDNPDVSALVQPDNIRAGSTVPANFPSVILANPQTVNLGRAAGGQFLTRIYFDLHIWALDQGANTATHIGATITNALWDVPEAATLMIQEYTRPDFTFMRDPDPDRAYCHGVGTVDAVVMWRP